MRQIFTDHITSFFTTGGVRGVLLGRGRVHVPDRVGGREAVDLLPVLCSGTLKLPEILVAVCPEEGV